MSEFQRFVMKLERIKRFSETGINKGKSQSSIVLEIDSCLLCISSFISLKPLLKMNTEYICLNMVKFHYNLLY